MRFPQAAKRSNRPNIWISTARTVGDLIGLIVGQWFIARWTWNWLINLFHRKYEWVNVWGSLISRGCGPDSSRWSYSQAINPWSGHTVYQLNNLISLRPNLSSMRFTDRLVISYYALNYFAVIVYDQLLRPWLHVRRRSLRSIYGAIISVWTGYKLSSADQ